MSNIDVSTVQLLELGVQQLNNKDISIDNVLVIWQKIALLIGQQLFNNKGIKLPLFGTFTWSTAGDVLFIPATELKRLKVKYSPPVAVPCSQDKVPVSTLNFALIASLSEIARLSVDKVYYAILDCLGKKLLGGRSVTLSFHKVVEMTFANEQLKCNFCFDKYMNEFVVGSPRYKNISENFAAVAKSPSSQSSPSQSPSSRGFGFTANTNSPRAGGGLATSPRLSSPRASAQTPGFNRNPNIPQVSKPSSPRPADKTSNNNFSPSNYSQKMATNNLKGNNASIIEKILNDSTLSIVEKIRNKIIERGGSDGIKAIQRILRIMDNDGDHKISEDEFNFGFRDYGIVLSQRELDEVFAYFDKDSNGYIDTTEFLIGIKGDMNPRRKALVKKAFDNLDTDQSGVISLDEIAQVYDVSKNPEVMSGSKSEETALLEFLNVWGGTNFDGAITYQEFEDYYKSISASIDDDDYFELMIRNAWRIAGGSGFAANTANRRVLVTKADGSQSVECINNELGLKAGDLDGIKSRLAKQGVSASNVGLYSGVDSTEGKNIGVFSKLGGQRKAAAAAVPKLKLSVQTQPTQVKPAAATISSTRPW